ncbi:oligosaccharide repeat unit polymerase [Clostridium sp. Marseille-P2415]|uniref:oligosaccharide repeat unit polymerase n=1 Tax=Clostridium sp. Marseille-P2415 TaxID=1805471 RepID=UPI0013565836|nr:oligosaccharide repeat unit polymerase [Clostridium sp. Marseille-P2415]
MGLFYLVCYAVITCVITIRSILKRRNIIYIALWCEYAVSSVFCVLGKVYQANLVGISTWHNKWYDLSDTTWWGYALIIICNLIAFKPFEVFDHDSSLGDMGERKGAKQYMGYYAYIYILLALIFVILSFSNIRSILETGDLGALRSSLYGNSDNESTLVITNNFVANLCYKLCIQFKYLSIFIALLMFKERYRVKTAVGLLVTTFTIYYIYASANAARGGLLIFVFCSFLMVLTFFKYMSKGSKRKLIILGAVCGGVVVSFFLAVTMSRLATDTGGGNLLLRNISFYLGHGPIEFSKVTGSLEDFAYGKTIIGRLLNHYFGISYSWENIQAEIGYPSIGPVFITYLGYIYTDFGIFSCVGFTALWSYFMCRLLRKPTLRISTVFIFLYYLSFYVTGNFAVGRLEYAGMITAHIIALLIRLIEDQLRIRSRKYSLLYTHKENVYEKR